MVLAPVLAQKGSRQVARTRSSKNNQPDEPPLLRVSHEQFAAELEDRIDQGKEILEDVRVIGDNEALGKCRRAYRQWNDYNGELLARRFTTSKMADDYNWWGMASVPIGAVPLSDKVRELVRDVDSKIGRLESLRGRVELFEMAKGPEWQGQGTSAAAASAEPAPAAGEPTIFIVHGHDNETKLEVHRFLSRVTGRDPVILHDEASRGGTVIEKFERVGSRAAYAVVLLTADDEGRANGAADLQPRGRQNVVFEFGYFVAKIGREMTALLYEPGVELPSDVAGLVYIELDRGGAWRINLVRELREVGISADLNKI